MSREWYELVESFRKQGKNWSKLNEQEREVWRDAYIKQFGREYKPRTLAERWAHEDSLGLSFTVIRKSGEKD